MVKCFFRGGAHLLEIKCLLAVDGWSRAKDTEQAGGEGAEDYWK